MEDNNQDIESLIGKQLHHELTPEEQHQLEQWLDASPANREKYDELAAIWEASGAALNEQHWNTDAAWANVNERLRTAPKRTISARIRWIAAACLLLVVVAGYILTRQQPREKTIFAAAANRIITLPDSSTVYLRKGSTLIYPDVPPGDHGERLTRLEGEAFFEVRHDPARPFRVQTRQATIEDQGTSFAVRQQDNGCQVLVVAGAVKCMAAASPADAVLLAAGQQARWAAGKWTRSTHADPNGLSWKNRFLEFNQAPLDSVLQAVQDLYGAPVIPSAELLRSSAAIRITARFSADQRMSDVLDEIRLMTGLGTIKKKDTLIFVQK